MQATNFGASTKRKIKRCEQVGGEKTEQEGQVPGNFYGSLRAKWKGNPQEKKKKGVTQHGKTKKLWSPPLG